MIVQKRILIITDEMEMGGTQRQITNLLRNIDKTNIDIELLYFINESPLIDELRENNIRVTKISKKGTFDLKFIINLISYVRNNKFDVIQSFAISAEFWGFVAYIMSPTSRFITSIRGVYEWYEFKHWFMKSIFSCFSYRVVGNSLAGIDYARTKMWCKRENFQLIYNGINTDLSKPLLNDYEFNKDFFYLLSVGRLIEGKNNCLLIDAMDELNKKYSNLKLLIIGEGPDRKSLETKIDKINASNIELLGEKSNVNYYMKNSDLLVHPSLREGLSNAILEAFTHNLLVLVSDADGNKELVKNNDTGLLFKNGSLSDLIKNIDAIINDKNKYHDCIVNASEAIKITFSIDSMCNKYQELYEK